MYELFIAMIGAFVGYSICALLVAGKKDDMQNHR